MKSKTTGNGKPEAADVDDVTEVPARGLLCPACGRPGNRVLYTRPKSDGSKDRVRECIRCGHQWQTEERAKPGEVIDRGGRPVRVVDLADFVARR